MQSNRPEKAADFYKQALKQDPYNEAIRKNYQIAMLKDKEKKNNQQQNKGKSGKDPKNKDQPDNNNPSEKQQNGGQGNQQNGQNQGKQNQQKQENKIPDDVEKSILRDMENREKETARRILNKNANSVPQSNEKDW